MQFMGVGWEEVVVIIVVALVIVGPERLPGVAYQIGKAVRTMQSYARAVRAEFSEEFGYIEEQYRTVKGELTEASAALRQEQQKFSTGMRSVTAEVQGQMTEVRHSMSGQPSNESTPGSPAPAIAPDSGTAPVAGGPGQPLPLVF